MRDLPWLIRASGPGPLRGCRSRTERAARDLAAAAAHVGSPLVLHEAVDIAFCFEARHLPAGTVDLRQGDALGHVLAHPESLLVTAGGHYIGTPVQWDARWRENPGLSHALLVSSAMSGAYYGCTLRAGGEELRFRDAVAEEVIGIAAALVFEDGTELVVHATTHGYRRTTAGGPRRARHVADLLRGAPGVPTEVTSDFLTADELQAEIREAGLLPPQSFRLAGRGT